jgi:hypothetical protein
VIRNARNALHIIALFALALPLQLTHAELKADLSVCASIGDDDARLRCYDAAVPRSNSPPEPPQKAATAEDKFGERSVRTEEAKTAHNPPELKEITAKITAISRRARGQLILTLDNDQVWAEKEPSTYFPVKIGDTVSIKARSLGSFQLTGAGGRTTQVTRMQ